jgi:IS30 family transposase
VGRSGSPGLPREVRVAFWDGVRAGLGVEAAAVGAGVSKNQGWRWLRDAGGVKQLGPVPASGWFLQGWEREEIAVGLAAGDSCRVIAARLAPGRSASTVSREVRRNSVRGVYRAHLAGREARERARRPKPAKLAVNGELRGWVEAKLALRWSPQQASARLREEFPGREDMRVSPETIYQSIYVQGRGALRRELAACLRTGRDLRRPRRAGEGRRGKIAGMVNISQRPAEAGDRAVPGHWEGDLIEGRGGRTHLGTLVERTTRFTLLVPLPGGKSAPEVADALIPVIGGLPDALRRSLTWDQGTEMSQHARIAVAADVAVYFCDPRSPWQRGSNENTNGLLRQYFPKGTAIPADPALLQQVAGELNGRPRKTLGWKTPAEAMAALLDEQAA